MKVLTQYEIQTVSGRRAFDSTNIFRISSLASFLEYSQRNTTVCMALVGGIDAGFSGINDDYSPGVGAAALGALLGAAITFLPYTILPQLRQVSLLRHFIPITTLENQS